MRTIGGSCEISQKPDIKMNPLIIVDHFFRVAYEDEKILGGGTNKNRVVLEPIKAFTRLRAM